MRTLQWYSCAEDKPWLRFCDAAVSKSSECSRQKMASTRSQNQWSGELFDPPPPPHPPIRIIYISNSISLCRNRRVEKTDWVIICIILTVLVDLMNSTNFGKTALSVLNLPMLQSIFWDQRNFFSCFLSSAAHVECA